MKIFQENFKPTFTLRHAFIAALYFVLSIFGILHHEMWLDEMHHFLLARDSASIVNLAYNARYDGHPLLWDLLLYFLTRFTHDPFYMQLLNILISLAAVIIFLRNAPFTELFKFLFVFSYFMLYEYNIISRNYAISALFLFISCSLIFAEKRNYTAIFISLLLLCCTHLFSLFCAVSLFIVVSVFYFQEKKDSASRVKLVIWILFFAVSVALILWSIFPPPDHFLHEYDTDPYFSFKRIGKGFSIFFKGFYPLPDFLKYNTWNTNLAVDYAKNLGVVLSVLCLIIPFILFQRKPLSLFVFYSSSIIIAVFIWWSPMVASERYFGFIFLLLVVSLWLFYYLPEKKFLLSEKFHERLNKFNHRFENPFVYSVLIIQVISAVIAYTADIIKPFSEGKEVANYLTENNLADKTIAVSNQSAGPPISAYLDKKLFYPETNQFGTFCKWNTNPFVIDKKELISRVEKITSDTLILIVNDSTLKTSSDLSLPVYSDDSIKIFYVTKFDKALVRAENYWLYEVVRNENEQQKPKREGM
ncbi:MAG: hypothetical protein ACHQD9_06915 [Chitinophagales bacterium]